jgi:hypothetical protein
MTTEGKFKEIFGSIGPRAMSKEFLNSAEGLTKRARVQEFLRTIEGPISLTKLCEAIGTSDFSYLLTADMNAQLLDAHARYPVSYPMWTKQVSVNDFKTVPLVAFERPVRLLQETGETQGNPKTKVGEGEYTILLKSYSDTISLTRQAIINDALGAFNQIPAGFSEAAAMTAENLATQIIADANGPHASMFDASSTYKNLITSELSYDAVLSLWKKMTAQRDTNGRPIRIRPKCLIVPPALEPKANEIVKAITVERLDLSSEVGYKTVGSNQLAPLQVAVNSEIEMVSTSNTYAAKQWYLAADPMIGRPAVAFGVYRASPNPRLFKKTPDTEIINGGMDLFSFTGRTLDYGIEWDIAAARLDYRYMGASKPTS